MAQSYMEGFREDLKEFYEVTEKFYRKEVTVPEYKSFSGAFGSYAQRGGERSMLRLRLSGGEINKGNLKFIADSIRKYRIDLVHFTTCQTVQLHNLTKETVCALVGEAFEQGIITRGGGGDYPRNVMCSPLSGVDKGEAFDVLPYAKEAADYLLGFIGKVKLPRKLKVCFSNNRENETHATFRDMGFVAKENRTFDVYIAGGLGIKPKMGLLVAEGILPSRILYCIKTMVEIFTEYGNYEKRAASRTRFLQETLGVEELQRIFKEKLVKNLETEDLDIFVDAEEIDKKGAPVSPPSDKRLIKQKQEGLYAVSYHPVGGVPKPDFFEKLYDAILPMEQVKVRLAPDQGLYVVNLSGTEALKVLELTKEDGGTAFERSTACIGAAICQVGIGNSQALLEACIKRVKEAGLADGVLPPIHISGCPSSCSAHQTAVIGLRGGKKQTADGPQDAFAIFINGNACMGEEQFGEEIGVMAAENIPAFFVELGRAVEKEGLLFTEFLERYPERIAGIFETVENGQAG